MLLHQRIRHQLAFLALWLSPLAFLPLTADADPPPGKGLSAAFQQQAKKPFGRSARKRSRRQQAQQQPSPERIREIQEALRRAGYLQAEPTGKWDSATEAAMRRFQKEHGHPETGKPDALSLIKLGLGPETAGQAAPRPATASGEAANTPRDP